MLQPVDRLDAQFLLGFSTALGLLSRPEVAERWFMPSVLPKMSVGALACHLGRQAVRAVECLPAATDVPPLASADAHYHSAAWVTSTSPNDPPNDRATDNADAALGADALVQRATAAMEAARGVIAGGEARNVVLIPWQGWSLRRDDFLLTRLVETVVHTDDLALSIDVEAPAFPEEVAAPVLELLLRLAVTRHGQSAVISTLTRRERSQIISAF